MRLEHWLYKLPLKIRSIFLRSQVEKELDEEFRYHLERRIEALQAQGMPAEEAHYAALRTMGGLEQQKERCRESRGVSLLEDLVADVRYAVRSFRNSPSLVLVIAASLALGIGANTAIFSVINAVNLKMLPVHEPERLVLLKWSAKAWPDPFVQSMEGGLEHEPGQHVASTAFSSEVYESIKRQNDAFDQTFSFASNDENVNLELNGRAESAHVQAVSGNFFDGLGVSPVLGRMILPSDDSASATPAAVVSHDFWRNHFGGDIEVSAKRITINGEAVTIVGVAPTEFFGIIPGSPVDVYIPLSFYSNQWKRLYPQDPLDSPGTWWLGVVGRLKPGIDPAKAKSELQVIVDRTLRTKLKTATNAVFVSIGVMPAGRGLNGLREKFSTSLFLLMGMVGLVLLIACGNVAGLLMARASVRQKEIAVRLSLGASRGRVIRQLLVESLLLALIGGAAGLLVSFWASSTLVRLLGSGKNPIYLPAGVDIRVLAFTAAVSVLSGMFFGLVPALAATRVNISPTLKDNAAQFSARGFRLRFGKALVGGQVALSLLLLIASGLLLRTLDRLQKVNLGFSQQALLTFEVRPGLNAYSDEKLISYYEDLQRRLQALPGVRSVAFTQHGPIDSGWSSNGMGIPGYTAAGERVDFYRHIVGPGYFATLNVPIVLGRPITERDTLNSAKSVVINETAVRKYFHGDNPIGKRLTSGKNQNEVTFEIVGVAKDVKYGKIRDDAPPTFYWSYAQSTLISRQMIFLVRTDTDPVALETSVRQVCLDLDKDVPVVHMKTEEEIVQGSLFLERTFALLTSAFGALALLLACIGLYGTIGYAVARRTAEIGVRMALGAGRANILRMVLGETLLIVAAGVLVGLFAAWAASRLLTHQLYGLSPHDPLTIADAGGVILAITLLAGYLPARRASRVEPMVALRCE
jgi:putative ABC transport system permease protein